nr:AraC family transcriptional regulator [uncultured Sphaerochaeta sp.]
MDKMNYYTDVLWMSRFHYKNKSEVTDHKHDFYQIIYLIEGSGFIRYGNERIPLTFPMVVFYKPDEMHGIEIESSLKTIDVKFQVVDSEFASNLERLPTILNNPGNLDILFLLESMLNIGSEERLYYRQRCCFLLNLILMQWIEFAAKEEQKEQESRVYADTQQPKSDICSQLMYFIDTNLQEELDSSVISKKLGYSYRHISDCCIKEYSMTPMHLLRNRRIQRAKELLMRDDYEIKEIAFELGFKSVYHFSRVFSEIVGQPPRKWKDFQLRKICRDINIDPQYMNELHIKKLD